MVKKKRSEIMKKLLSLCMIVKNEEKNIRSFLTKTIPFVDEINIVDTGSTDNTIEIIREIYPDVNLREIEWGDNFSYARNISLDMANCEWVISLDVDEEIDKKDFLHIRRVLENCDVSGIVLLQRSYISSPETVDFITNNTSYEQGKDFAGYIDVPFLRLFKNRSDFRYEGVVHELMDYALKDEKKLRLKIPIHHFGMVSKDDKFRKNNFYLKLLEKEIIDAPDLFKVKYTLARQYFDLKRYDEAYTFFKKTIEQRPDTPKLYEYLGLTLNHLKRYKESIPYLEKSIDLGSLTAKPYSLLGVSYFNLKDYDKAILNLKKAIELNPESINEYNILGYIFYTLKDFDNAKKYLLQSLSFYPGFINAKVNLFLCLFDKGEVKEAIVQAKSILALDKSYASLIHNKLQEL